MRFTRFIPYTICLIFGLVYYYERSRVAGFGDGLGFLLAAVSKYELGTNATNHFLYVIWSHFLFVITRINALDLLAGCSIVYSVITLFLFYKIVSLQVNTFIAVLSTFVLGISFTFWRQSEIIEVYSLNNLLYTATLYCVFYYQYTKKRYLFFLTAVMLGLATLTHIQNILLLPFWIAFVFYSQISLKEKILSLMIYCALAGILIWLPLITGSNSIAAVFFERAGDAVMNMDPLLIGKGFITGCLYFGYNFLFNSIFIIAGVFFLWRKGRNQLLWLSLGFLPFWFFAMRYTVSDNYMFFTPAYILLLIACAKGWGTYEWPILKYKRVALILGVIISPFIYKTVPAMLGGSKYTATIEEEKAYKGGLEFYLYPGRRNSPDALQVIDDIHQGKRSMDYIGSDTFSYNFGVRYNEWIGRR